jgi:hypothetical protein
MDGLNFQPKQDAVAPRWRARPSDPDPSPPAQPSVSVRSPHLHLHSQTADRNRQLQQPPHGKRNHTATNLSPAQPGAALHCTARAPVAGSARITIDVSCRVVSCRVVSVASLVFFHPGGASMGWMDGWMDAALRGLPAHQIKSNQPKLHHTAPHRTAPLRPFGLGLGR